MTSTRAYVLARKSSVIRRARGSTSAKDGRSPKPAKCASIGTPARRIASRPLRPTVTTARSPDCPVISRAANRIVLVLSGPARPRSVVTSTIRRLPPSSRSARRGWSSSLRTAARSARTSSSLSLYGRDASVASWARLSLDAATNCIARVICLMFLTAPMRRRMSRWLAIACRFGLRGVSLGRRCGDGRLGRLGGLRRLRLGRIHPEVDTELLDGLVERAPDLVGQGLTLAELLEDRRLLALEEAVELGFEFLDARRRDVVELAG